MVVKMDVEHALMDENGSDETSRARDKTNLLRLSCATTQRFYSLSASRPVSVCLSVDLSLSLALALILSVWMRIYASFMCRMPIKRGER